MAVDAKFEHALLFLDGTAADYMHTVAQNLPVVDQTWLKFCELLRVRFGNIDPDAEFWDQLRDLKQGTLTAAEYAHKMRHCFNGITVLSLSMGEKFERCMSGLNIRLRRDVVTAPVGLGVNGKWMDIDQLMSHTVMQSAALARGGAAESAGAAVGTKRSAAGNGQASGKVKKQKKQNNSGSHPRHGIGTGRTKFREDAEKDFLTAKKLCWHCCQPDHSSDKCPTRGQPRSAMPAAYKASLKAKSSLSFVGLMLDKL